MSFLLRTWSLCACMIAALLLAAPAAAQNIRTEQVRFASGASGTVIRSTIRGDEIVDYVLRARAGQQLSVDMATSNAGSYFNVTAPGASSAMHIGSVSGNRFKSVIPSTGDYRIRVYLMRAAARRKERADYTLTINVDGGSGGGVVGSGGSNRPEDVCRAEVSRVANTRNVRVTGSQFSQAGTMVRLAVGPTRAPWQCIAYRNGTTSGVQYLGDDSASQLPEPPPDYADGGAGGPDFWRVVSSGLLNIRSGPSTNTSVVTQMRPGSVLRNLGCSRSSGDMWCQVSLPENGGVRGWAMSRFLAESGAPASQLPSMPDTSQPDNSDGQSGGPGFWRVIGVASNDTLNIRSRPSARDPIVTRVQNGTVLRNLGCRHIGGTTWCKVSMPRNDAVRGWANARFLTETSGSSDFGGGGAGVGVPQLYARPSGEVEVRWSSGCTVLFDPSGYRITAGSTCSADMLSRSDDAVRRYRREQGL